MQLELDYANPKLLLPINKILEGAVNWRSPSNLAIIKYWGKYGNQLPQNPSLSMTLENAWTETKIAYQPRNGAHGGISLEFEFESNTNEKFQWRIVKYFENLIPIFPFLEQLHLKIQSANSFPHSAGIASSASAMSALALCLCSMEDALFETLDSDSLFDQKASYVARLGSGSACRSIFEGYSLWGRTVQIKNSSDEYAIPYLDETHAIFKDYIDDILIVDINPKPVSSTLGHSLMEGNDFAKPRYALARKRLHDLIAIMRAGDAEAFGQIAEDEAMNLHAMMMASTPSYLLLHPNTIAIINKVRKYRSEMKEPLYFSLDAGPNIHLLYPVEIVHNVRPFIEHELSPFCIDGMVINDYTGRGPEQL